MGCNCSDVSLEFHPHLCEGRDVFNGGHIVKSNDSIDSLELNWDTFQEIEEKFALFRGIQLLPILARYDLHGSKKWIRIIMLLRKETPNELGNIVCLGLWLNLVIMVDGTWDGESLGSFPIVSCSSKAEIRVA